MDVTERKSKSSQVNKLMSIAEVDKHIAFIEAVLKKYSYEEGQLTALLEKTKRKQQDDIVNMSIIGEFSSGKSSFINALLRSELLSSCSLQGTTVANTVIEYAPYYAVELTDKNRKVKRICFANENQMVEKIESFTTDSDFAQTVRSVKICFPAKAIRGKIRIIDTPGTNATELWHEDVTKNAIRSLSDASVILMDATRPFPETICKFVSDNLTKVLPQCVFVLTKFDIIEESEREKTLEYSRLKVKEVFGIEDALILPYSSISVLEKHSDDDGMYKMSAQSEQKLFDFMMKQRATAQIKKIMTFIDLLYESTANHVKKVSVEYGKELNVLMQTNRADLPTFALYQKKQRMKDFRRCAQDVYDIVDEKIYKMNFDACENLRIYLTSKRNVYEFNAYVNANFLNACHSFAEEIIDEANKETYTMLRHMTEQLNIFFSNFSHSFKDVGGLEVRQGNLRNILSAPRKMQVDYKDKMAEGAQLVNELQRSFVEARLASARNNDNMYFLEQYRNNAEIILARYAKSLFNRVCYDIKGKFNTFIDVFAKKIETEIESCCNEYSFTINDKIKAHKEDIKSKINDINKDLGVLEEKKYTLSLIENQLDMYT
ncbi:MAG: hypothetical protein E7536_03335 [Ruminococcaceae bacterium]|nr:hypothetical protein [Oscillospiraceae bacterium]